MSWEVDWHEKFHDHVDMAEKYLNQYAHPEQSVHKGTWLRELADSHTLLAQAIGVYLCSGED